MLEVFKQVLILLTAAVTQALSGSISAQLTDIYNRIANIRKIPTSMIASDDVLVLAMSSSNFTLKIKYETGKKHRHFLS